MRYAYLDCSAGISGNMFLGALLDLGLPAQFLTAELEKLQIPLPSLQIQTVNRKGINAVLFEVPEVHEHHHRHLHDICSIINESTLDGQIKAQAIACFKNLAQAEAKVHGVTVEEIHFHEVGAIDAIIDIVGSVIGLNYFKFAKIFCSPIRVGFGTVQCAHGEIPLPAPAALELLNGFPVFGGEISGEWATPTGAAIVRTFASPISSLPQLTVVKIGYGAGSSDRKIPNVLRIISGESGTLASDNDYQMVLETNIDNMNPEFYGYLGEKLLEAGARDYCYIPVYMKKNRPATLLTVIVDPENVTKIESLLFTETTTLGIRKSLVQRVCMGRIEKSVSVYGKNIKVKLALDNDKVIKYSPEYEDCLKVAKELGYPLKHIYEEAGYATKKLLEVEGSLSEMLNK